MDWIQDIFSNVTLWAAVLAWVIAQAIKFFTEIVRRKRVSFLLFFSSGGMPSSHTAFVTAMTAAVGLEDGFSTPLFAIAAVVSMIVMYDAAGVRRAAGRHAAAINSIYDMLEDPDVSDAEKLKELLGHNPLEVTAGAVLGILTSIIVVR